MRPPCILAACLLIAVLPEPAAAEARPAITAPCPPAVASFVNEKPAKALAFEKPRQPAHLVVGLPRAKDPAEEKQRVDAFAETLPLGAKLEHHYAGLSAVLLRAEDDADLPRLAEWLQQCRRAVRYVDLDYTTTLPKVDPLPADAAVATTHMATVPGASTNDPYFQSQLSFFRMRIPDAWAAGFVGSPQVVVAVIDSGIDLQHPDLQGNLWASPCSKAGSCPEEEKNDVHGRNFARPGEAPEDGWWHGTQVAGVIGAVGNNGVCVSGASQRVALVALRVADQDVASLDAIVRAVQYATAIPADVINLSWAIEPSDLLHDAVTAAAASDVVVVAAAPRETPDVDAGGHPLDPCGIPLDNVICVTATDDQDALITDASVGKTSVDLAATVTGIRTTFPGGKCLGATPSTSMAAPHVAGVAALLRAKCERLPASEVRKRLLDTVGCNQCLQGKTVSGGRMDAAEALALACPPAAPQAPRVPDAAEPAAPAPARE